MTLSAGTPANIDGGNISEGTFFQFDTALGLCVYRDVPNTRGEARTIDISYGSLSVNNGETIISPGDVLGLDASKLEASKAVVAFGDNNNSNYPKARVLINSGGIISAQALSSAFESAGVSGGYMRLGAATNALVLAAYRTTAGMRYCRLSISGNTVTPGTPVSANTDGFPISVIGLSTGLLSTLVMVMFRRASDNALAFQVVNLSGGITQGTVDTLPIYTLSTTDNAGPQQAVTIEEDSKVVAVFRPTAGNVRAVLVNLSGTSIDSYGDVFTVANSGGTSPVVAYISSSKILLFQTGSSPNKRFVETLSIDSDTITADGDGAGITDADDTPFGAAILTNTKAVVIDRLGSDNNGYATLFTGVPVGDSLPDERRMLGLAIDQEHLYFTSVDDDVAYCRALSLGNLALQQEVTFGAVTYAELDADTHGLRPVDSIGQAGYLYVHGREGADKQIYQSINSGLSFSDIGDGGWAASKIAVVLRPNLFDPEDLVAIFGDDDIYRSRDDGATWIKSGDGPSADIVAGARHPLSESQLLIASSTGGDLDYTNNYGYTWADAGDGSIGVVNDIEVIISE